MKFASRLFTRGSMFGDVARTGIIGIVVMILVVIAQGIAARIWIDDAESLSIYLLVRRINLALVPMVILGMTMALSRHMPIYAGQGRAGRRRLTLVTMSVVLVSTLIVSAVLLATRVHFARLIFGGPDFQHLLLGLVLLLAGTVCFNLVTAYFQGRMWMRITNVIQFTVAGLVQLVVLLVIPGAGIARIVEVMGIVTLAISLIFLVIALADSWHGADEEASEPVPSVLATLKSMLLYGLPRVPGFLAMSGLWLLSPILVVQLGDLGASRYLITALLLYNFVDVPFKPMTVVFLPRFAEMKAQGRYDEMSRLITMLGNMLIQIGLLATTQLAIFIPVILRAWMKYTEPQAYVLATIIVLAVPAYLVFDILRNPIDSYTSVPINTFTITGSLILLALLAWVLNMFMDPAIAVAWATTVAFLALGTSTMLVARRLMVRPGVSQGNPGYLAAVISITVLGGFGLVIKSVISGIGDIQALIATAAWAIVAVAAFSLIQYQTGAQWAIELRQRIANRHRID